MVRLTSFSFTIFAVALLSCASKSQENFQAEKADAFKESPVKLSNVLTIAKSSEPGERIIIKGKVYESDGSTPAANVIMYFYHTNAKGIYAKRGDEDRNSLAWWHGYNRGWLKTNSNGEYEVHTIKPAPYPARIEPAHIHCVVQAPSQVKGYPVGDVIFQGDELITDEYLYKVEQHGHPRFKGVTLSINKNNVLEGQKDYVLYAQYDKSPRSSGLLKTEECPAFRPKHIWGADKGSTACPMCKYGDKQGIMAWINSDDWSNASKLARSLENGIYKAGSDRFRAFMIFMKPDKRSVEEFDRQLVQFANDNQLEKLGILSVPSPTDLNTAGLYRINPHSGVHNTIFIYKNRRVFEKRINLQATDKNLYELYNLMSLTTYNTR